MVFSAGLDVKRAVKLFEHHNPRQMVRERHGGHGKAQFCLCFQRLVQPAGTAD